MLGIPIRHHISLEAELFLEQPIKGLAVLASVRVVDALVGAHDRSTPGQYGVLERPEVQLVHRLIVNVGRNRLHIFSLVIGFGVAVNFLLVGNEVL